MITTSNFDFANKGLTWTLFEQIKRIRSSLYPNTAATDVQNSIMGCLASATTVCIMIPMDTVKTFSLATYNPIRPNNNYNPIKHQSIKISKTILSRSRSCRSSSCGAYTMEP